MICGVPKAEVVMFPHVAAVGLCCLECAKGGLDNSKKGTDTEGRPPEQRFSFAAPPEAPPTDLLAPKHVPFWYCFFHQCRFQVLEFVAAAQLDKPTDHRFDRLEVIAGFAQDKQIISATGRLDHDQQQSLLSDLRVKVPRQIERTRGKNGAIVGGSVRIPCCAVPFDYLNVRNS